MKYKPKCPHLYQGVKDVKNIMFAVKFYQIKVGKEFSHYSFIFSFFLLIYKRFHAGSQIEYEAEQGLLSIFPLIKKCCARGINLTDQ